MYAYVIKLNIRPLRPSPPPPRTSKTATKLIFVVWRGKFNNKLFALLRTTCFTFFMPAAHFEIYFMLTRPETNKWPQFIKTHYGHEAGQ